VNCTVAEAFPPVTVVIAGAPGTVDGVTAVEAVDGDDDPTPLVATTVNVYAVPFASPFTTQLVALAPVALQVNDPGDDVAV